MSCQTRSSALLVLYQLTAFMVWEKLQQVYQRSIPIDHLYQHQLPHHHCRHCHHCHHHYDGSKWGGEELMCRVSSWPSIGSKWHQPIVIVIVVTIVVTIITIIIMILIRIITIIFWPWLLSYSNLPIVTRIITMIVILCHPHPCLIRQVVRIQRLCTLGPAPPPGATHSCLLHWPAGGHGVHGGALLRRHDVIWTRERRHLVKLKHWRRG